MGDEEHAAAPDRAETDEQDGKGTARDEELAENAGDAFRELYEPGPNVHRSSRPLEEEPPENVPDENGRDTVPPESAGDDTEASRSASSNEVVEDESVESGGHGPESTASDESDPDAAKEQSAPSSTDVDGDHTRSLDGEPADTTPVDELELSVDDLDGADSTATPPGPPAKSSETASAEEGGLLGRLKQLLFDW